MKYLKFTLIFIVIILIKNYWPAHHNVKIINNYGDNIKAFKTNSNSDNITKYDALKDYDFKNYCFKKDISWKWNTLIVIYKNLKDQQDYFKAEFDSFLKNSNIHKFQANFNHRSS